MIDKLQEQLVEAESSLTSLKDELTVLQGKSTTPGEEGAIVRSRMNELVLAISNLEEQILNLREQIRNTGIPEEKDTPGLGIDGIKRRIY